MSTNDLRGCMTRTRQYLLGSVMVALLGAGVANAQQHVAQVPKSAKAKAGLPIKFSKRVLIPKDPQELSGSAYADGHSGGAYARALDKGPTPGTPVLLAVLDLPNDAFQTIGELRAYLAPFGFRLATALEVVAAIRGEMLGSPRTYHLDVICSVDDMYVTLDIPHKSFAVPIMVCGEDSVVGTEAGPYHQSRIYETGEYDDAWSNQPSKSQDLLPLLPGRQVLVAKTLPASAKRGCKNVD